ncbi:MAG: phage shock protein A [Polaribacter sp.]|jgi:phage shock protein A
MNVFKRFSDILNSNLNSMLDKAEDPEKLVNMIIREMETTLFNVRSESAKTIANKKEMQRQLKDFESEVASWQKRAELALDKGRDDLAKQALEEKLRIAQAIEVQSKELGALESALEKLEHDISKLQLKLNEAIARRKMIVARHVTVKNSIQIRQKIAVTGIDDALNRFNRFEKRLDEMDAEVEAMDLGQNVSLSHQIDSLQVDEDLNKELEALKLNLKKAS